MASGVFVFDGIGPALDILAAGAAINAAEAMMEGKARVQMYAQSNAPWADRTGQARAGLIASVYNEGGEIVLELAHSVEYGQWLELIQDGRFAIIMPTLEALGPEILRDAGAAVFTIGPG